MAKKKQDRGRVLEMIRRADREVILGAARLCDGHSILKPEAFAEKGLPLEVIAYVTATHRSDGTPKGTLFVEGRPVPELSGVYGLDLLQLIADALGLEYRRCIGRGFQARATHEALRKHFTPQSEV